jgi:hypothetical protein
MATDDMRERQQLAAERILEDEGLTGDLPDPQAQALIAWASAQAGAIAGDATRSDEQVSAAITELRRSVRAVAASGEADPQQLVAQAAASFAAAAAAGAATIAAPAQESPAPPASSMPAAPTSQPITDAASPRQAGAQPATSGGALGGLRRMLQRIGWRRRSHRRRAHTRRW